MALTLSIWVTATLNVEFGLDFGNSGAGAGVGRQAGQGGAGRGGAGRGGRNKAGLRCSCMPGREYVLDDRF